MNIVGTAGALLLVAGSIILGLVFAQVIAGGFGNLSPFEALIFTDGLAATMIGAWILLQKNP